MPLITPRRRFMITAPLALLLPAGLLTYVGISIVEIDRQGEDRVETAITKIVGKVRNRTTDKIDREILEPFRVHVENRIKNKELLPEFPIPDEFSFTTEEQLEFASRILVFSSDYGLYLFEREDAFQSDTHVWILAEHSKSVFSDWLQTTIRSEINLMDSPSYLSISDYLLRPYPDSPYPAGAQRELAAFILPVAQDEMQDGSRYASDRPTIGFTFNLEYMQTVFFDDLINSLWRSSEEEFRYPIAIEDTVTGKRIAEITGEPFEASTVYSPRAFNERYFPWYKIIFSKQTAQDIIAISNYQKNVNYCLIAAANVIMIVGVFGALRNLSKELALSDMRSDFVARVSHELRTPLSLIRLYAETLEMGRMKDKTKQIEYLRSITKESERLTQLINNILNFSQIEADTKQYRMAPVSIEEVIYESVSAMEYHLKRNGMKIDVYVDQDMPDILGDNDALKQTLFNLLSNAMKYSGEGKIIRLQSYLQDEAIVIDIVDQGIGIAPEHQEKIFDDFYRVDDPLVRQTGGSGLGLAVVKHIVKAHHGRVEVQSVPGKGSAFTIRLPVRTPRSAPLMHA